MTTGELISRTLTRLGDDPTAARGYYARSEALTAINQIYRMMCFLTLCLETTVTFSLTSGTAYYKMLTEYADWILPLRIRLVSGAKIRPARLADFSAISPTWNKTAGTPTKYALEGFDLLAFYKQPGSSTDVLITYARNPAPLVSDSDVPELQGEYHQSLIDGAIPLMRAKEGAQEWQKTLGQWQSMMDATHKLAEYIRARNREQGYDYMPFELARFDKSKILKGAN